MEQDINYLLKQIKQNKVLVVGDIMLDCTVAGEVTGISAEAPVLTFREGQICFAPGGAGNVALNLVSAKQTVKIVAVIGNDENGKLVLDLLHKAGVSTEGIVVDNQRKTTIKKRYYTCIHQQLFRADSEDICDISQQTQSIVMQKISEAIADVDIVVLSDYLKGCLTAGLISEIVELAHQNGKTVIVDPKDAVYCKYKNCDIIKPNQKELALMTGKMLQTNQDILDACRQLCLNNGHKVVVATLGNKGMALYCCSGEKYVIDAVECSCVDVVGAGDTAVAYLAVGVASGLSLLQSLTIANNAGAKKVVQNGTVPVNYLQLGTCTKRVERDKTGILKQILAGKKVVFTNGCFDILHAGHVSGLQQAKSFGDVLVVGINSDGSVQRLKGKGRPIVKLDDRIKMLEALSCVDYIIPFDEDTPLTTISDIVPQILVKGEEYRHKNVVGADIVLKNGGEVRFVDMYGGYSTSSIINSIKEQHNE